MHLAKPCSTPLTTSIPLSIHDSPAFEDPRLYRSVVGTLQYATITRPDISFAVNKVSQFMHMSTTNHWTVVKRILRYLKGTFTHGLLFKPVTSLELHAYSDADWTGSIDDCRSTLGYSIFLVPNLISWSAKKQPTVSRSSTEAEYRSLALTCAKLLRIQYLLQELYFPLPFAPTLWCDNIEATFLASNLMFHVRTKYVEIDYHFVRERITSNQMKVSSLCSRDQIADILTKSLSAPRFSTLRAKLTVCHSPSACGGVLQMMNWTPLIPSEQELL
jgi:hypothetical protein